MCRLALKLNISFVHPALIPTLFSLPKENQGCVKPKMCILKGPVHDDTVQFFIKLFKALEKQQMPSTLRSQTLTIGCLNSPAVIM